MKGSYSYLGSISKYLFGRKLGQVYNFYILAAMAKMIFLFKLN